MTLKKSLPFVVVPLFAVVVLYAPAVSPPSEGASHSVQRWKKHS